MSTEWQHHRRTQSVTHSKDDALSEREFECLVEGAQKMDDYQGTEARFIVMAAGRLGLRAGEIAHMTSDWINWRDQRIEVPAHQPCDQGRDGGLCGHCRQLVEQCATYNDKEESAIAANWWRPKTEAAVRGVPFGWCPRAEIEIERFFERFDRFERSFTAIGRRVTRAAEHAPTLEPDDVYPHALRATAATLQAGKGLSASALCNMFGWVNLSTAQVYIQRSDENTQRAVRSAHSQ
jgi:integrase